MRALGVAGLVICLALGVATDAAAMVDPEGVRWKALPLEFVTSVYRAALGRDPTQAELAALANVDLNLRNNRWNVFWNVLNSPAYLNRFGNLPKVYSVYWNTLQIDTPSGRRPCHCYYAAEFSGDYMPSPQYMGYPYPAGQFTFPVALALVALYAGEDRDTCPYNNCGLRNTSRPDATVPPTRTAGELAGDWTFHGFMWARRLDPEWDSRYASQVRDDQRRTMVVRFETRGGDEYVGTVVRAPGDTRLPIAFDAFGQRNHLFHQGLELIHVRRIGANLYRGDAMTLGIPGSTGFLRKSCDIVVFGAEGKFIAPSTPGIPQVLERQSPQGDLMLFQGAATQAPGGGIRSGDASSERGTRSDDPSRQQEARGWEGTWQVTSSWQSHPIGGVTWSFTVTQVSGQCRLRASNGNEFLCNINGNRLSFTDDSGRTHRIVTSQFTLHGDDTVTGSFNGWNKANEQIRGTYSGTRVK
jgi:hypothetical protein